MGLERTTSSGNDFTNWIYEFTVNPEQVDEGLYRLIPEVLSGS